MSNNPHKGWNSRGYLPHADFLGLHQLITFRLGDALPQKVIADWKLQLAAETKIKAQQKLKIQIDRYEDAGHGKCLLNIPACAKIVQNAFIHNDQKLYTLIAWCIMPNHIHVLINPEAPLDQIIQIWKSYTAHAINKHLNRKGPLWHPEYHDRYIRDQAHFDATIAYIHNNPVKANLSKTPETYPHSSAYQ